MRSKNLLFLVPLLCLAACSPHPAAGGWRATSPDAAFGRLEIRYDGRADFYTSVADQKAAWRCFWAAADKRTVGLKCINAADAAVEREFRLAVDAQGFKAILKQGENTLGRYQWQPPTDP